MSKELLQTRMKGLHEAKEQMVGQYNALIGRIQECEHLLAEIAKTECVKSANEEIIEGASV